MSSDGPNHLMRAQGLSEEAGYAEVVARLLRPRLRQVILLFLVTGMIRLVLTFVDDSYKEGQEPIDVWGQVAVLLVGVWQLLLLSSPSPTSLWRLRVIEGMVFGLAVGYLLWLEGRILSSGWYGPLAQGIHSRRAELLLGDSLAMPWVLIIFVYALFIPTTAVRCAVMMTGFVGLPLCGAFAWHQFGPGGDAGLSLQGIAELGISLVLAALMAVLGSYRIDRLEQQAYQARCLGQYRLLRKLGEGGMGEVHLAEHQLLKRRCAIKLIHHCEADDPQLRLRFEREVQAMASLTHPNTVEVYDYGQAEDGTLYYAMEYLPGMDLDGLVRRFGPQPPGRVVHLLRQICGALAEAHRRGLIHRDVKPSNLLLCCRGGLPDVVKLLDFGLVKVVGPRQTGLTMEGTVAGTPSFLSPEQAQGHTDLDPRSDLYSVGGVAFYLLTGRPVFVCDNVYSLLNAHCHETPEAPGQVRPGLPGDLDAVILRCLEKEPGKRFASADELAGALSQCGCAAEWTTEQASEWWRTQTMDHEAEAISPFASTLTHEPATGSQPASLSTHWPTTRVGGPSPG